MDQRELPVSLIGPGSVIVLTGVRYHVRDVRPELGRPDYVYIFVAGDEKPWHKRMDDTLPVAYV